MGQGPKNISLPHRICSQHNYSTSALKQSKQLPGVLPNHGFSWFTQEADKEVQPVLRAPANKPSAYHPKSEGQPSATGEGRKTPDEP